MARRARKRRPSPNSVLTIEQLAADLKIAKSTAYKQSQYGRQSGRKVGRHCRFDRDTIDESVLQRPASRGGEGALNADSRSPSTAVDEATICGRRTTGRRHARTSGGSIRQGVSSL
ncbi:MAG: hypothetical protein D6824_07615 [Planctomycetota bacterium]|nr:MAG: hypothetical protein D6824_07615 [Planctomycetota bacterium]